MTDWRYQHKPPAPSVRQHIGSALQRARGLSREERTLTREELVEEIIAKLPGLPPTVRADLRKGARRSAAIDGPKQKGPALRDGGRAN